MNTTKDENSQPENIVEKQSRDCAGNRLKAAIKEKGFSYLDAAEKSGVSVDDLLQIVNNVMPLEHDIVRKFEIKLDIPEGIIRPRHSDIWPGETETDEQTEKTCNAVDGILDMFNADTLVGFLSLNSALLDWHDHVTLHEQCIDPEMTDSFIKTIIGLYIKRHGNRPPVPCNW